MKLSLKTKKNKNKIKILALSLYIFCHAFWSYAFPSYAASLEELTQDMENRKALPVESNEIENWPKGPAIGAEAAIVMEANTGIILYSKNIHEQLYPASTTKILTCLIAAETSSLDEMVSFSENAVFSIPRGSSNMGMDMGQALTMEEALYGILVGSANETANAVAEHIGGSIEGFADMMNEKAKELGCTDSHFANPNGLHDDNHYTSAYDLATIARSFFQNELTGFFTVPSMFRVKKQQPFSDCRKKKPLIICGCFHAVIFYIMLYSVFKMHSYQAQMDAPVFFILPPPLHDKYCHSLFSPVTAPLSLNAGIPLPAP